MIVRHLSLVDFRNYETAEVELHPGANLFVGRNGQGKTNLVESIGYLSTLSSHRVPSDQAMIRSGADAAIIRARLQHGDRQLLVEAQLNRSGPNRAQVNRGAVKPRELSRYVSSVLFAPEDLALVRGEPSGRRRFLDGVLVQRNPRLSGVLSDYERSLRQRNMLLKSARASGLKNAPLSTLDIWDERVIEFGSELMAARSELVAELEPHTRLAYAAIAGDSHDATLSMQFSVLDSARDDDEGLHEEAVRHGAIDRALAASWFSEALERSRRQELERAITLVGPHRDDLVLTLNGLPARGYASHGESWSFALALKLATAEVLRQHSTAGDPIIVLDDVFAELDASRRERLTEAIEGYEQVLITAAVFDDVPAPLAAHTVHIDSGRIVEAS
ncbi:DNA replication/repair protein RecF [Ruicaihuangia caeni]|uniref:DNA replication/repair protein RecF n=1 Tax=Ruicaihuangia caeni TaxID=3042517 RepID=UPI0033904A77